jgi:hypothetical protein
VTFPLLAPLQRQLKALAADLRTQTDERTELREWLRTQYDTAFGTRTGGTYETWRDEQVDQAAVGWLLGTVFVRFCEDNDLIDKPWIAGPGDRTDAAVQAQTAWLLEQTELRHARHWLREAFSHLAELPATAALFDAHNPVWRWDLSADAAGALLDFWRRGAGVHDFTNPDLDTRFLGDLYQDLSVEARKRYALLQTPEFVEEFILDLTLEESLKEYGLEDTSLIDPTCGSGHFLLGAFGRLVKRWEREHPAMGARERVQKALDQVTGVDINPFAVAIARFRLLVAALQTCDEKSLTDAPGFRMRLAAGDSLLKWGREDSSHQGDLMELLDTGEAYAYYTEDAEALADYLRPGQYTVAAGNPPYITVKDKFLNGKYRKLYKKTCSGKYALSVPFAERFFDLVRGKDEAGRAGIVGQITTNSFMKREFGKKFIEDFLAREIELTSIIDTSGAYIPGHGTDTILLVGRRRYPRGASVKTILRVLDEPGVPDNPAEGLVWTAIVRAVNDPRLSSGYVTAARLPQEFFAKHPWSLAGGGASGVQSQLENSGRIRLEAAAEHIGVTAVTGEDDLYLLPTNGAALRLGVDATRHLVEGEAVRDYLIAGWSDGIWPYDNALKPVLPEHLGRLGQLLITFRSAINRRKRFGTPMVARGLTWWEWQELYRAKLKVPLSITWAEVATHNHFVLDRGGKIFKQTAPVIKLLASANDEDHLELVGLLNSSAACFWLRQVSHVKGGSGIGRGIQNEEWEGRRQFNATRVAAFPIPTGSPLARARNLDSSARDLTATRPAAVCAIGTPSRTGLSQARAEYDRLRSEMVAVQEELDWEVYRLYGLLDDDLTAPADALPALTLGERAFEIMLARKVASGEANTEWFSRHGSTPITEIPAHWPEAYREVVARRIEVIESRPDIALIERPECKRRWASVPWEVQEKAALRDWLLDRLEAEALWRRPGAGRPTSVAVLADEVSADPDFRLVLDLYCGRDDYDVTSELTRLVADEAVPFLAAYRYKPSGLDKRLQWERTWELQRREDAGETLDKPIPVPPKYAQADFARTPYWRNRGKLDVPKERFVAYPHAGRNGDRSPVIGWAGWDHLEQAQALAALYVDRRQNEGWPAERLLPLLAGLVELEPWLHQWHGAPAAGYPGSPAEFYTTLIDAELAAHGADRAEVGLGRLP